LLPLLYCHFSEGEGSAFAVAVGALILMENDVTNAEFNHFNTMSDGLGFTSIQ
jgi:hypothetical protein